MATERESEREREKINEQYTIYIIYIHVKHVKLVTFLNWCNAKRKREKENKVHLSHVFFGEFSTTDFRLLAQNCAHRPRVSTNDSSNDISSKIVKVSRSSRVRTQQGVRECTVRGRWNVEKYRLEKMTRNASFMHSNKKRFYLLICHLSKEEKINKESALIKNARWARGGKNCAAT